MYVIELKDDSQQTWINKILVLIIIDHWGTKDNENQHSDSAIPPMFGDQATNSENYSIQWDRFFSILCSGHLLKALKSQFLTSKPGDGPLLEHGRILNQLLYRNAKKSFNELNIFYLCNYLSEFALFI